MKTITISKKEENIVEQGIQIRTSNPASTLNGRIFFNKNSQEFYYEDSQRNKLNIGVYLVDPVSPLMDEMWINATENTIKFYDGTVQNIVFAEKEQIQDISSGLSYLSTLNSAELKTLASTQGTTKIIEAFNTSSGVHENTNEFNSKLRLNDNSLSGSHINTTKTSAGENYAEGVVVGTSVPMKVKLVENIDSNTDKFVLDGDQTDCLAIGSKFVIFEKELSKNYFGLNGQLTVEKFVISTIIYNPSTKETEITFDKPNDFNSEMSGQGVFILPLKFNLKANSTGSTTTMNDLELDEVFNIDGPEKIIGKENARKIKLNLAGERMIYFSANHSENKKFWIIIAVCRLNDANPTYNTTPVYQMFYSDDWLKTINRYEKYWSFDNNWTYPKFEAGGAFGTSSSWMHQGVGSTNMLVDTRRIRISDDGRFYFALQFGRNDVSYHTHKAYFGKFNLSGEGIKVFKFNRAFRGGRQDILSFSDAQHEVGFCDSVDWETNIACVQVTYQTGQATHFQFHQLNFETGVQDIRGYTFYGGASNDGYATPWIMNEVINVEGENHFFLVIPHVSNYCDAYKIPCKSLLNVPVGTSASLGSLGSATLDTSLKLPSAYGSQATRAFSNSSEGGNKGDWIQLPETTGSWTDRLIGYEIKDQKIYMLWYSGQWNGTNNPTTILRVIDLARTRKGLSPKVTLNYISNTEFFTLKFNKLSGTQAELDKQLFNLNRNGALSSITSVGSWDYINNPSLAVNGNTTDYAVASSGDVASLHNGKGLQVTFSSAKAVKRFSFAGYVGESNIICNHAFEYYNGSSWVRIATVSNASILASGNKNIDFNLDGSISSTQWRWYIENWVQNGTNFYLYELETYDTLPPYTAGAITSTITKNFTASQIKTVVEALANVGAGNATVTTIGGSVYSHSIDQLLGNSEFDTQLNWDVFRAGIGAGYGAFNYADDQVIAQTISGLKIGVQYTISLNIFNYTNGTLYAVVRNGAVPASAFIGTSGAVATQNISGNGTYSFTFVATSETVTVGVWASSYSITSSQVRLDYLRLQVTNANDLLVPSAGAVTCIIELTGKLEPFQITLNTGSNVTVTTNEVGRTPRYLKIANTTDSIQKYSPETGALIPVGRQMAFFPQWWESGYGVDERRAGHAMSHRMVVKDKTIYYHGEAKPYNPNMGRSDNEILNYLIKVPDYTKNVGSVFNGFDSFMPITFHGIRKYQNVTKTKLCTIWNVKQNTPIGDENLEQIGKLPIRTMLLKIHKNYNATTHPWAGYMRDYYFRIKICNTTNDGTLPDENSVIAISTKFPLSELPGYPSASSSARPVPFCFDNVFLNISQKVAFVLEIVDYNGNDTFPWNDQMLNDYMLITFSGLNMSGSTGLEFTCASYEASDYTGIGFSWKQTSAVEAYYGFTFEIMDTYLIPVPFLHEGKDNLTVSTDVMFDSTSNTSRNILGCTLADMGEDESDRVLYGTYRLFNHHFSTNSSGYDDGYNSLTNAISFGFKITDSNVDGLPVIGAYKILGEEADSKMDEYTAFMYYPKIDDNTADITEADPTKQFSDTYGKRHAFCQQWGGYYGYWYNYRTNFTQLDRSDLSYGLKTNPLFKTGYAWKMNGATKYQFLGKGFNFGSKPFIIECELMITQSDVGNFNTHKMIFSSQSRFYFSIYRGKIYVVLNNDAHSTTAQQTLDWWDVETVPVDTYFRIRFTRDSVNGFRVFINFSKDDENTWEERFSGTNVNWSSRAGASRWWTIGINNYYPTQWVSYGGYGDSTDTSYMLNGWLGYLRVNIGSSTFKTVEPYFGGLPFGKVENYGKFQLALKAQMPVGDSVTNYPYVSARTICDFYLLRDNVKDAKISSQDHAFKFKGNIAQGQNPTVKVEIEKVSNDDVAEIQGYVVQFDRK